MAKLAPKSVSLGKTLDLYAKANGNEITTRNLLGFFLREGRIQARAKFQWKSDEANLLSAWKAGPPADLSKESSELKRPYIIQSKDWRRSVDWANDLENCNFRQNRMIITIRRNPMKRVLIQGIAFRSSDLRKYMDPRKQTPGIKSDKLQWRLFWHEIIALIMHNRTDFGRLSQFPSNDKLYSELTNFLTDDAETLERLGGRLPFTMKADAVIEEIDALRHRFGLMNPAKQSARSK